MEASSSHARASSLSSSASESPATSAYSSSSHHRASTPLWAGSSPGSSCVSTSASSSASAYASGTSSGCSSGTASLRRGVTFSSVMDAMASLSEKHVLPLDALDPPPGDRSPSSARAEFEYAGGSDEDADPDIESLDDLLLAQGQHLPREASPVLSLDESYATPPRGTPHHHTHESSSAPPKQKRRGTVTRGEGDTARRCEPQLEFAVPEPFSLPPLGAKALPPRSDSATGSRPPTATEPGTLFRGMDRLVRKLSECHVRVTETRSRRSSVSLQSSPLLAPLRPPTQGSGAEFNLGMGMPDMELFRPVSRRNSSSDIRQAAMMDLASVGSRAPSREGTPSRSRRASVTCLPPLPQLKPSLRDSPVCDAKQTAAASLEDDTPPIFVRSNTPLHHGVEPASSAAGQPSALSSDLVDLDQQRSPPNARRRSLVTRLPEMTIRTDVLPTSCI